jgi:2-keto-3-deoxy-galactonokinase
VADAVFLAVDWGTTNRRVYTIDADGAVIATERDDRGVLSIAADDFPAEVAGIRARFADLPMLCAGMVGSVRGWVGGRMIISPNTNVDVISAAVARGVVSLPGYFTPTEALSALAAGASGLKLFPAEAVTPAILPFLQWAASRPTSCTLG